MGAGSVGSFGNTKGSRRKIELPERSSQLKHIFGNRPGHLEDTPQNRKMILDTVNDKTNYVGTDPYGNDWYSKNQPDGSQIWGKTRKLSVSDAGKNEIPRRFDKESGLNINPKKNNTWRRKKKK